MYPQGLSRRLGRWEEMDVVASHLQGGPVQREKPQRLSLGVWALRLGGSRPQLNSASYILPGTGKLGRGPSVPGSALRPPGPSPKQPSL